MDSIFSLEKIPIIHITHHPILFYFPHKMRNGRQSDFQSEIGFCNRSAQQIPLLCTMKKTSFKFHGNNDDDKRCFFYFFFIKYQSLSFRNFCQSSSRKKCCRNWILHHLRKKRFYDDTTTSYQYKNFKYKNPHQIFHYHIAQTNINLKLISASEIDTRREGKRQENVKKRSFNNSILILTRCSLLIS